MSLLKHEHVVVIQFFVSPLFSINSISSYISSFTIIACIVYDVSLSISWFWCYCNQHWFFNFNAHFFISSSIQKHNGFLLTSYTETMIKITYRFCSFIYKFFGVSYVEIMPSVNKNHFTSFIICMPLTSLSCTISSLKTSSSFLELQEQRFLPCFPSKRGKQSVILSLLSILTTVFFYQVEDIFFYS